MKLRNALLAATILAAPATALAQPVSGIYVGLGAGANFMSQENISSIGFAPGFKGIPQGSSGSLSFNTGWLVSGSAGWGFGNGLRVEAELAYRSNGLSSISAFGTSVSGYGNAKEDKGTATLNALYDFTTLSPWVVPYVGIGAGYGIVDWSKAGSFSGNQGAFAVQGIAGLAFPIASVPGLSITTEFKFLAMPANRTYNGGITLGKTFSTVSVTTDNDNNYSVLVGLRYAFGRPPPPPPPAVVAPAPAPARSYLVFFDWDKYNLTDRAKQIIAEAAANIPKVQHTRIEVNGYTDTTGTAKYNMALSIRRANAVAAELVRLGVAKSDIAIQGFGDTHLLVPTGPQVREPQNRRVEIIIK